MSNTIEILAEKRKDLFQIDPRCIIVDENFNVRADYGDIESLARSIAENGVMTPLRGYRGENGEIHLTDGYRRNRAIQYAIKNNMIDVERDEFRVPFFIEKKGYRVQDRIVDMFITQDNKKLSDIEVAEVFHRLHHRFEMSVGDIAKKIGKSPAYVSDMLELITADNETISLVRNGKVKATAVVAAIKETKKEIKDKTAPANTIQNAAVHEKIVNAVEKAKSEGKSVAGKRHVSPRKEDRKSTRLNSSHT